MGYPHNHAHAGIARSALIIIIAVVVLLVAGAGAYFLWSKRGAAPGLSQETKTLNDECLTKLNDADLCRMSVTMADYFASKKPYSSALRSIGGEESTTMTTRVDSSGNTHTTTTVGDSVTEAISIGDDLYTKDTERNVWLKMNRPKTAEDESASIEAYNFASRDDVKTPQKTGTEACGDLTCFTYTFAGTGEEAGDYTMWFDNESYLVRKMLFTQNGAQMEMTYEYGDTTVAVPSPVEDISTPAAS